MVISDNLKIIFYSLLFFSSNIIMMLKLHGLHSQLIFVFNKKLF